MGAAFAGAVLAGCLALAAALVFLGAGLGLGAAFAEAALTGFLAFETAAFTLGLAVVLVCFETFFDVREAATRRALALAVTALLRVSVFLPEAFFRVVTLPV